MNKNFNITISRPSCGNGDEYISIQVQDNISRARFLELKVDYKDFAQLVTGLSNVHCRGELKDASKVGKKKESKKIKFEISKYGDKSEALEKVKEFFVDGFESHFGFSSQNTWSSDGDKNFAETTIFRWVE